MSRHRELKQQRESLIKEVDSVHVSISRILDSNRVHKINLDNIEDDLKQTIEKASNLALISEINKNTFDHSEILAKLQTKRDEILTNRDKKLLNINYENFSKKAKEKLSIEDSVKKSVEVKNLLDEKMGKRLSLALTKVIPSNRSFNSLNEIQNAFDELDYISNKISTSKDFMPRIEKMIFSYDTQGSDSTAIVTFVLVIILISIAIIFSMPLFVLMLVGLFSYNIYKSFYYYKSMSIAKVLVSNIAKINNSIEEGIKNKVKSKRSEIENKFEMMLNKVDSKILLVEELISDTTAEVEADFSFNSLSITESFRSKKDSILEQVRKNEIQVEHYHSEIERLKNKIKEIDSSIREEASSIYEKYYPSDGTFDELSSLYIDDILIDIVDDSPIIHELPVGSAVYIYKDESEVLKFINLYLVSLISRMSISSLYIKIFDIKYAGTKLIDYAKLDTVEQIISQDDVKACAESLTKEMLKRIKVIGSNSIEEYNKAMIADESSPQPYQVIIDLFGKPGEEQSKLRQILINGFNYGLIYNLFVDVKDIEGDNQSIKFLIDNYSNYYFVSNQSVVKKSSKFLTSLMK